MFSERASTSSYTRAAPGQQREAALKNLLQQKAAPYLTIFKGGFPLAGVAAVSSNGCPHQICFARQAPALASRQGRISGLLIGHFIHI